jgi:hypothetical protein
MIHTEMSSKIVIDQTRGPDNDPDTIITIYHKGTEPTVIRVPAPWPAAPKAATMVIKAKGHEPFVL